MDEIKEALSYDDVLLVPKLSDIRSRKDIDISTYLTRKIKLNMPIIPANMDTVCEAPMAIAIARAGGIGILHRFMSIEEQVEQVLKVKRAEAVIIEKPYTLTPEHTISDAKDFMKTKNITGIIITDSTGLFLGIVTHRDLTYETNLLKPLSEIMTPKGKAITAEVGTTAELAKELFKQNKVEKLPLVDKSGYLRGLITAKDLLRAEQYPSASKDKKGRLLVGAAIGVKPEDLERAEALLNAGCDVLCIDIAHGHSNLVINMIKELKKRFGDVQIIAGNVATADGTRDLILAGADAVKCGVGPGCFAAGTRILMSNGFYKNIEEIKQGDRIINKDGNVISVLSAFSTGVKKVFKLRNSIFYEDTYVTPNHQYWIGDLNSSSKATIQNRGYARLLEQMSKTIPKTSKYKWKEMFDLKQDVLLMPSKINFELKKGFEIVLEKRFGGNPRAGFKYRTDKVIHPNYEVGYIFGTFLGDGTAHCALKKDDNSHIGSVRWSFTYDQGDIADKLAYCIKKEFNGKSTIDKRENTIEVRFFYKPLADFLDSFGKRDKKHLPEQYLVNNKEYLTGLHDGLIDSDGTVEDEGRIRFFNSSIQLIELFNITSYLLTGVFPNNQKKIKTIGNLKGAKLENIKQPYFSEILNTGAKRVNKFYQIAKLLPSNNEFKTTEVYDLEVDCPTHSFIANNAIVHNSICVTRIITGAGVPQITAILECAKVGHEYDIPIIADGGIKQPGDLTKALAAGASTVMMGGQLAGTDESPGQTIIKEGKKFKIYRGSAGFGTAMARKQKEKNEDDISDVVPEGVEGLIPYRGSVNEILFQYLGGLRSGMSYIGAHNIQEMWKNVEFIKMSSSGLKESHSHDINKF